MSEWKTYKFKNISKSIFSGGTPSTTNEKYWNGKFPWLSSGKTGNRCIAKTENSITELGVKESSTRLANYETPEAVHFSTKKTNFISEYGNFATP